MTYEFGNIKGEDRIQVGYVATQNRPFLKEIYDLRNIKLRI